MKSVHREELYIKTDNLTHRLFDDNAIFFDIETTGFSPAKSTVYMIGCARKKNKYICVDQFLAENFEEEKLVITAFLEILKQYDTIISFNGVGFDIPFLKAKCDKYNIPETFKYYNYIDIFKSVSRIKFLLKLENYKQKSIEKFLGLNRDDKFSGGELIDRYFEYVNSPDEEVLDMLYLHNYEDVLGMIELLPVLSYLELFNGKYSVISSEITPYKAYDGKSRNELIITLRNDYVVPKRLSYHNKDFYVAINQENTTIRVGIYSGELKYFYPDYKNYYYLPKEDMAIHKSVAAFVDGDYKEKCRAFNCYNRKSGDFLIQYKTIMKPEFKVTNKDKVSYFELTEDFYSSDIMLRRYVEHLFEYAMNNK